MAKRHMAESELKELMVPLLEPHFRFERVVASLSSKMNLETPVELLREKTATWHRRSGKAKNSKQ